MVWLGLATAAILSLGVGWVSQAAGRKAGLIDRPDEYLKPHEGKPVPLGGIGILLGLHAGLAVVGLFDVGLLVATAIVWIVGLVDDLRGLSPVVRLGATVTAGYALVELTVIPLTGTPSVFWIVAVVVIVNSVNLLDGLDALAGSVTAVAAIGLGVLAFIQGVGDWWAGPVLASAVLGFLFWNRPVARLYLGDNGAYVVGVALTWVAMDSGVDAPSDLLAVALVGVPLLDLAVTLARRMIARAPLFAGDRDHTYDRMAAAGRAPWSIAGAFAGAQILWTTALIATSELAGDVLALIVAAGLGALAVLSALVVLRHSPQVG